MPCRSLPSVSRGIISYNCTMAATEKSSMWERTLSLWESFWSCSGFKSQVVLWFLFCVCVFLVCFCTDYSWLFCWCFNPPCIAHYKVDILCAYKVGFRSPLYIPTMGDKAVFCARNMPLDLEDDFIATLAFQFIPGWFPTRKRLNICGNAFYRPLVPFKEWP